MACAGVVLRAQGGRGLRRSSDVDRQNPRGGRRVVDAPHPARCGLRDRALPRDPGRPRDLGQRARRSPGALVAEGLLQTRVYQPRPERHEYRLTDKGLDLVPALLALMQWGDRWAWPDGAGPVRVAAPRVRARRPRRGALPALRARAGAERACRGAERSRWRRARAGRARTPVGAPARREPGAAGRLLAQRAVGRRRGTPRAVCSRSHGRQRRSALRIARVAGERLSV